MRIKHIEPEACIGYPNINIHVGINDISVYAATIKLHNALCTRLINHWYFECLFSE